MQNLVTERLELREYTDGDWNLAHRMFSDPETMKFWPRPFTEQQTTDWIERSMKHYREKGFGRWVVLLKNQGQVIGDCGIRNTMINGESEYDLGYIIHHPYWKQGYGLEAARACLQYGLNQLELPSVCANMAYDHTASRRVAEKLGMTKEAEFYNPRNRDLLTYIYRKNREG